MKIAIFSDIHSNFPVFKKAYDDALSKKVDMFLFLGDYVTDGFDANKILNIIKSSNGYAINGNREVYLINYHKNKDTSWDSFIQYKCMKYGYECLDKENLEYIEKLPIYKVLTINNKKICISHSTPYSVLGHVQEDSYDIFDKLIEDFDCDIYLFGHEHKYYHTKYKDKYFINAGSIGLPADGLPFKYGILSITDRIEYKKIEVNYDFQKLEKYYKNSDFYKEVNIWCCIILELLKSGEDHPKKLMDYVFNEAKNNCIDVSKGIPNDLFVQSFNKYMQNNMTTKRI